MSHLVSFEVTRSNVLTTLLKAKGHPTVKAGRVPDFSYGTRPTGRIRNLPVNITAHYCSKRNFYLLLQRYNRIRHLPTTYTDLSDLPTPLPPGLWFVKKARGSRGEAVYCFNDAAKLKQKVLELRDEPYVIQQAVADLDLIEGRKYTLRVYLLQLDDGRVFVYRRIVGILHRKAYSANCANFSVQVDHRGATRFDFAHHPHYQLIFERIVAVCRECFDCFRQTINLDGARYHLYGLDFLVDENLRPWFIEMNGFPNLDSTVNDVREQILLELFNDLYGLVIAPNFFGEQERKGGFALC